MQNREESGNHEACDHTNVHQRNVETGKFQMILLRVDIRKRGCRKDAGKDSFQSTEDNR